MNLIGSLVIAFSMYSKIPMPHIEWTKERMKYAMCFFPLIGAVAGTSVAAVTVLLKKNGAGSMLTACIGTCLPLLITGGIHMDGFLDVTDARSSYQPREKKLEILKDPHTGAFAIMSCGVYLLLYAGFFSQLKEEGVCLFAGTFVLTRALSGLSVVSFPMAKLSGLAATFSSQAHKRVVAAAMAGYLVACGVFFLCFSAGAAVLCMAVAGLVFWWYRKMSEREFGGITGDLAGYFLQTAELALLITVVVITWK